VLLVAAVVLFANERRPFDLVALLLMSALLLSGIVTPAEGVADFSNILVLWVLSSLPIPVFRPFGLPAELNQHGAAG
jgi:di/tricarboxylate transporter